MREICLKEYERSEPVGLSVSERDALSEAIPSLSISHAAGESGKYTIRPSSTVGAVEVGGLSVVIKPKIGVGQLISLACYAMGRKRDDLVKFRGDFAYAEETALPEFLARAFAGATEKRSLADCCGAMSRGKRRCRRFAGASGSTIRSGAGSACRCRLRFATTSSRTTSYRTAS